MRLEERAQQAWQILTGAARGRQVLTYAIVANRIGMAVQGMGQVLGHIMWYCEQNDLPPLTILVVQKETGTPGPGLTTVKDIGKDREAVFDHNWDEKPPPSAADFAVAAQAAKTNGKDRS